MREEYGVWHLLSDRDEQVRPAAEAFRVVLCRRLHIRISHCEMKSLHGSPLKNARRRVPQCWIARPDPYLVWNPPLGGDNRATHQVIYVPPVQDRAAARWRGED
jgi:hypothetical protein